MNQKVKENVPITEYMHRKATKIGLPLSGTFELTPLCNFSCKMCYVRKSVQEVKKHPRKMMDVDEWLQIAKEAREEGMLYLLLTGGEPLAYPMFWELYEKLSEMGFVISINTNGSLIDEDVVEKFKQMPPKQVNITLYGASDFTYERLCNVHNVFEQVSKAIDNLHNAGIRVKLNASLTPYNIMDLEKIVKIAKEKHLQLDATSYMFPPLRRDETMIGKNERFTPEEAALYRMKIYYLQNGREKYISYLKSIKKGLLPPPGLDETCIDPLDGRIRCRAGRASFWITWDGWLTPCGMMPEPKVELSCQKFGQAWRELVKISSEIRLSGICAKCSNKMICHSCAAMALAETGRFEEIPQYLCKMTVEMKRLASIQLIQLQDINVDSWIEE